MKMRQNSRIQEILHSADFNVHRKSTTHKDGNKKLRYRKGTARRAMSVEILSTAVAYEKLTLKGLQ